MRKSKIFGIITVLIAAGILFGCGTDGGKPIVTIEEPGPEVKRLFFREAGFNLAYFGLRKQSPQTIKRAGILFDTGLKMIEEEDAGVAIDRIVKNLEMFDWGEDEDVAMAVMSGIRILKGLLVVDLSVLEYRESAVLSAKAFLDGALDGVKTLKKLKGQS